MRRYIDADALLQRLPDDLPYKASVKRVLMKAPTADVAPKSEVAMEIVADMREMIKGYENIDVYLDRIEKKYTEVEQ